MNSDHSVLLTVAQIIGLICAFFARPAFGGEEATGQVQFLLEWGQQGSDPGQFNFPIGIAINASDEIFVTDFYNARVQKFSSEGSFIAAFAVSHFPGGVALDHEGNIFVAHAGIPPSKYDGKRKRDKIAVITADGKPLREWGKFGAGDGEFDMPGGIAISRDGRVYVADQCNRRIQVFDTQGKFLTKWGKKGFQIGEFGGDPHPKAFFAGPTFLACDRLGNIFTSEATLGRVQKFTSEGKPLFAWGDNEVAPGKFGGYFTAFGQKNMQGPSGICFDSQGRLWTNSIGGRIQQFSDRGKYLFGFGKEGKEPGKFYAPHGLAINSCGCLFVVDSFNHRIQKFDVGR
jgi:DNA-binding beta-propeller fold protein YncE